MRSKPLLGLCWIILSVTCVAINTIASSGDIGFVPNCGQWPDSIRFRTESNGTFVWFTSSAVHFQQTLGADLASPEVSSQPSPAPYLSSVTFAGATPAAPVIGEGLTRTQHNFFLGDDAAKWRSNIPSYESIRYDDLYPGIDLRYYSNNGRLEYDFIISPGASAEQITMTFNGIDMCSVLPSGELEIRTPAGVRYESCPMTYQLGPDGTLPIASRFVSLDSHTVGFSIEAIPYPNLAVVIDPELSFSTYLGTSAGEDCQGIAVDDSGNTYITGFTLGADFPMVDPLSGTYNGGITDIVVSKLSADGTTLLYSTYIGGSSEDLATALARDSSGAIYVAGMTTSPDFPRRNPIDTTLNGGRDVFALKLSPDGDSLLYSTFFGGSANEFLTGVAVQSTGELVAVGFTQSNDFPTSNGLQPAYGGGTSDGFIFAMAADGASLHFSSNWGGNGEDFCETVTLTPDGTCIMTGATKSSNFPAVAAYDSVWAGGYDLIVSALTSDGDSCLFSTYIGDVGDDLGYGIDTDNSGRIHIHGVTTSPNFPLVLPFDSTLAGPTDGCYLRLSPDGATLEVSSLVGGNVNEHPFVLTIDKTGNIFLIGTTNSSDFPTVNPLYASRSGGDDIYVTQLNPNADSIIFCTFLGGSLFDGAYNCDLDRLGNLYCIGQTPSTNFPMVNAYDDTQNGNWDWIVFKVAFNCCDGMTGNVDMTGIVDLGDLSLLIAYLTVPAPSKPSLLCVGEGNINATGIIDLADLSQLVAHLTVPAPNKPTLPNCP